MDTVERTNRALTKTIAESLPVVGNLIGNAIEEHLEQAEDRRVRMLYEKLEKGKAQLTPELIQSEDFLFCLMATLRAVKRTRRTEKIEYFANLILNGTCPKNPGAVDRFEAMLELLDQLSCGEIEVIQFLAENVPEGTPYQKTVLQYLDDAGRTRADSFAILARLFSKGLLNIEAQVINTGSAAQMNWTINPLAYRFLKTIKEYRFPNT